MRRLRPIPAPTAPAAQAGAGTRPQGRMSAVASVTNTRSPGEAGDIRYRARRLDGHVFPTERDAGCGPDRAGEDGGLSSIKVAGRSGN